VLRTFDAWNRLATVTNSSGTVIQVNRYDGVGRRIAKAAFNSTSTAYDRTDFYYNQSWQVLEERKAPNLASLASATSTVAGTPYAQYLWDLRYIDAPVCRWRTVTNPLDECLYYCNDANMNVTALVDSSSGTVVERYQYDPYGKPTIYDSTWTNTIAWANSRKNEILSCGYRYDPETGQYHVRYRYYHPTAGRWTIWDPIGYAATTNLYEYVASSPIAGVDPTGLAPQGDIPSRGSPWPAWTRRFGPGDWTSASDTNNRIGDRPCFDWRFLSRGNSRRAEDGSMFLYAFWHLYVWNLHQTEACFGPVGGVRREVRMKQWVRHATGGLTARQGLMGNLSDNVTWDPWKEDNHPPGAPSPGEAEARRQLTGTTERPLDVAPLVFGRGHQVFPSWATDPRAVGWQINQMTHERAGLTFNSWWDMPGTVLPAGGIQENWDGHVWQFYIEIYSHCRTDPPAGVDRDRMVDRAWFAVGLTYRDRPVQTAQGAQTYTRDARYSVIPPIWLGRQ